MKGGVQSAGGERSANFARRTLAEKGGYFCSRCAASRASLLHFLVNFFRLVDRHFLRVNRSRRAELGGRIQCGRKSTVEFGNISDGKNAFFENAFGKPSGPRRGDSGLPADRSLRDARGPGGAGGRRRHARCAECRAGCPDGRALCLFQLEIRTYFF